MPSAEIKILVADDVSDSGLQPLRGAGFVVEKRTGLAPESLREALRDRDGLVVRSETKVTADLMDHAPKLRVVGRAGVGVDPTRILLLLPSTRLRCLWPWRGACRRLTPV
jgi:phosphoglycerate dehydrogenase-like enzyme